MAHRDIPSKRYLQWQNGSPPPPEPRLIEAANLREKLLKLADCVERECRPSPLDFFDAREAIENERHFAEVLPGFDTARLAGAIDKYRTGEDLSVAFGPIPPSFDVAVSRAGTSDRHIAKVGYGMVHFGYSQNAQSILPAVMAAFLRCLARVTCEFED
ncbi:hypothetical protein [Novosphingobium aromaticivorans]|uniref:hypothetical protein n=1 Tax=Novosphingobium aromaticivorans TaxID=48935 RepID=UPI000038A0E3|nr:hypothetical protein [Novosphingobium aromaticivorans]